MLRYGGAVILMQQNLIDFNEYRIDYEIGNSSVMKDMQQTAVMEPFSEKIVNFFNQVSRLILADREAKEYPDVVTFGFWLRKASLESLKTRFMSKDSSVVKMGRGIAFHIAPSNVPVNYAYSLATGLLCGNANIVRIPSKDFPQVQIINRALCTALEEMKEMIPYIVLVKYGHDSDINTAFSSIADIRVVWGGDNTIEEFRKSPMKPRATEITFADRYSLAVIDSDIYMSMANKAKIANDFYNDTYLTDQNACTSPRAVVWLGDKIAEAKEVFWRELHKYMDGKYELSGVQAVNKLTSGYLLAVAKEGVRKEQSVDNLIVRMSVPVLSADLMEMKDNSGYFFETECKDILELRDFCNDTKCQTVSYIGRLEQMKPLLLSGISGVDRVVPVGKTMDFDLLWDGYDLFERMTRNIVLQ